MLDDVPYPTYANFYTGYRVALKSGDWVMKGGNNVKNWVMSGKMNPLRPQHHVPFKQGRTFTVPKSSTQFPKGIEKFKGLPPWNQRIMK